MIIINIIIIIIIIDKISKYNGNSLFPEAKNDVIKLLFSCG